MEVGMRLPTIRSAGRAAAVGAALLLVLSLGLVAACGGSSAVTTTAVTTPTTSGPQTTTSGSETTVSSPGSDTTAAAGGSTVEVIMKNRTYEPKTVTIKVGDTVTWVNQDSPQHDAVADNGEFDSGLFDQGETFSFTFTAAGTYPYHCSIHPGMEGTVVVE
jgi:plastocyanin